MIDREFMIHAGLGSLGSVSGILVGAPADTVKVLLQSRAGAYRGVYDCIRKTVKSQGGAALFKGAMTNAIGQIPNNVIVFGTRGSTQAYLDTQFPPWSLDARSQGTLQRHLNTYLAGSWAGFLQTLALCPFEHVKCQLQVRDWSAGARRVGMMECAQELIRAKGVFRGLYRGFWMLAWRDAPTYGLYFVTYDVVREALDGRERSSEPSAFAMLTAGGVAGVVTWAIATPFDVVKSIIQGSPIDADPKQTQALNVARELYREHGIRGFLRGLGPSVIRAFPVNAVTFFVYDSLLHRFFPKEPQQVAPVTDTTPT